MIESDILVSPTIEPVSLSDAKSWLKIDGSDDDLLIAGLISSARLTIEAITGLLLIAQTWRFRIKLDPSERKIKLPHRPIISLSAAQLRDRAKNSRSISLDGLAIERASAGVFKITDERILSVAKSSLLELDAVMGFGPTATSIPSPILTALQMLISFWHERRGDDPDGSFEPWPPQLATLLQPYREMRL
ncbi:MAG: head-tail connector protein [Alphaproteobacteria bacterium]